ncbi:MAG: 1-deoxy-D-xylulose-5-phosphate synthase [Ruminococcaceae bacterium]|nr:1-deoxy-D-xylulose-5-phosphate synthase [Oscillospiraceae bacterium]
MNNNNESYKFLGRVNSPDEIKKLSHKETLELCSELRNELISTVRKNGGHLASNLGVVELTCAIHRVFNLPSDKLIFDVGHQSYVHKLLTGRYKDFKTLRTPGGLLGFECRRESDYDAFGVGHAGTSLSAAIGFAEAERIRGGSSYSIAVVGDGAYTCGMIHEALNNCHEGLRLIIILNENEMSISKNIGGFANYIARVRSSKKYYSLKKSIRSVISKVPLIGKPFVNFIRKQKKSFKNMLFQSNFFEDMGIYYLGPCDGNDLVRTERLLREARDFGGCCIVHVKTTKGLGYTPAEENPGYYHGISPEGTPKSHSFSHHFGKFMCERAENDKKLCAITAAMSYGTGLDEFSKKFPDRFFDVGIAEEHAATFASGLCAAGMKPVFAVYSTFLQRSYDCMVHDIALQSLPVVFCIDRAGLAMADGPTHHGIFDVSMILSIPGTKLYMPIDFEGFDLAFESAMSESLRPSFIRYKSGDETRLTGFDRLGKKGDLRFVKKNFEGCADTVVITYGKITNEAVKALNKYKGNEKTGIILLETVEKSAAFIDSIVSNISENQGKIIFLEEGIRGGGVGMTLYSLMAQRPELRSKDLRILAIDSFGHSNKNEHLFKTCKISWSDVLDVLES